MDYGYLDRLPKDYFDSTVSSAVPISLPSSPTSPSSVSTPETTSFFTRQLCLPVLVTVYQNLEPLHWDVLYLRQGGAYPTSSSNEHSTNQQNNHSTLSNITLPRKDPTEDLILLAQQVCDLHEDKNDYCLVTLDIRNTWTIPFDVSFKVADDLDCGGNNTEPTQTTISVQPGWTRR